ncbi:cytochrome b/b6 domain-containing protein, partial [Streptomyces heliomycini]
MRPDDSTADDWFAEFLNFGVGVLSLVCLSCSVIWGLVAQDRILLGPRQRILAQAVHRTTAVASIAFLLVHIGIKLALDHTTWIAAIIPFGLALTDDEAVAGRSFLIGLGTLAGLLMIFVGITGVLRNRFASPAPVAARWRAMHMLAYPAWCAALVHGLYAGRSAKPIFLILYGLSLVGVMAALVVRASPARVKRRIADRVTTLLGLADQQRGRGEQGEESRSRAAGSPLPGYGDGRGSARGAGRPRGDGD